MLSSFLTWSISPGDDKNYKDVYDTMNYDINYSLNYFLSPAKDSAFDFFPLPPLTCHFTVIYIHSRYRIFFNSQLSSVKKFWFLWWCTRLMRTEIIKKIFGRRKKGYDMTPGKGGSFKRVESPLIIMIITIIRITFTIIISINWVQAGLSRMALNTILNPIYFIRIKDGRRLREMKIMSCESWT